MKDFASAELSYNWRRLPGLFLMVAPSGIFSPLGPGIGTRIILFLPDSLHMIILVILIFNEKVTKKIKANRYLGRDARQPGSRQVVRVDKGLYAYLRMI